MESIYFHDGTTGARKRRPIYSLGIVFGVLLLALSMLSQPLPAQKSADAVAEFKSMAQELSTNRSSGVTESEPQQEKTLALLDSIALADLNGSASPDLDAANRQLAGLTSRTPPVGENYRLLKLGGTPSAFALVVNFGVGGPAAVRIYSGAGGKYALAARVDQFSQKGFLDSDIEVIPVSTSDAVFVTVAGRTDDLSTGMFSAWRFDGHAAVSLWTSELLQQSNYEADENGFHLTYCGMTDDDQPDRCIKMRRDLYRFQDGQWTRVETVDLPAVQPSLAK